MSTAGSVEADQPTRVAIGLIERGGCYLIRQRPPGSIMAGIWEFPGGKCEPGEDEVETVRRECLEETGLDVITLARRAEVEHRYPHGFVRLTYFDCRPAVEIQEPSEGSGFRWVAAADLVRYCFPEANEMIVRSLSRS